MHFDLSKLLPNRIYVADWLPNGAGYPFAIGQKIEGVVGIEVDSCLLLESPLVFYLIAKGNKSR